MLPCLWTLACQANQVWLKRPQQTDKVAQPVRLNSLADRKTGASDTTASRVHLRASVQPQMSSCRPITDMPYYCRGILPWTLDALMPAYLAIVAESNLLSRGCFRSVTMHWASFACHTFLLESLPGCEQLQGSPGGSMGLKQ